MSRALNLLLLALAGAASIATSPSPSKPDPDAVEWVSSADAIAEVGELAALETWTTEARFSITTPPDAEMLGQLTLTPSASSDAPFLYAVAILDLEGNVLASEELASTQAPNPITAQAFSTCVSGQQCDSEFQLQVHMMSGHAAVTLSLHAEASATGSSNATGDTTMTVVLGEDPADTGDTADTADTGDTTDTADTADTGDA